jgi:Co/Zn/Cd efflux system component
LRRYIGTLVRTVLAVGVLNLGYFGIEFAVDLAIGSVSFLLIALTFSETRAAFLSARNDALANVAIVATGLITAYMLSALPDLLVGLGIAAMNADAAPEVYTTARNESRPARS